jgi:hypothetical protein
MARWALGSSLERNVNGCRPRNGLDQAIRIQMFQSSSAHFSEEWNQNCFSSRDQIVVRVRSEFLALQSLRTHSSRRGECEDVTKKSKIMSKTITKAPYQMAFCIDWQDYPLFDFFPTPALFFSSFGE